MTVTTLPIPETNALSQSNRLWEHILSVIKNNHNAISFADYMELVLYTPGLGYYSNGLQAFGAQGDFTTAPELSPLFSRSLARQCEQVLTALPTGDILEIGPGSGQMAADILLELAKRDALPNHYYFLELSGTLRQKQQEKIKALCPEFLSKTIWLDTLPRAPFTGIILANEVLDAMPVQLFQVIQRTPYLINVIEEQGQLKYAYSNIQMQALCELQQKLTLPNGYLSEINLNLAPWISSLSDILSAGVILIVDYGFPKTEYYHPDRAMGTLMCHYRHYAHTNPFLYPGLQDITTHVDFSAIAEASHAANLDILGYCEQASFLLSCGLTDLIDNNRTIKTTETEKIKQNQAINLLTSPAEMGELFKVLALGRAFEEPLLGFTLVDRQHALYL